MTQPQNSPPSSYPDPIIDAMQSTAEKGIAAFTGAVYAAQFLAARRAAAPLGPRSADPSHPPGRADQRRACTNAFPSASSPRRPTGGRGQAPRRGTATSSHRRVAGPRHG